MTKKQPPDPNTFGGRIYEARKKKRLTLEKIGKHCGVSAQAVGQWESNEALPTANRITSLADVLGIAIEMLLGTPSNLHQQLTPQSEISPTAYSIVNHSGQICGHVVLFKMKRSSEED